MSKPISPDTHIHPKAFEGSWTKSAHQHATEKLRGKLAKNLHKQGIELNWDEYMKIMDSFSNAEVTASDNRLVTSIPFESAEESKRFSETLQKIFDGMTDSPRYFGSVQEDGTPQLTIENMRYADLCTIGTVGMALFQEQYKDDLGLHLPLLCDLPASEIKEHNILDFLSPELSDTLLGNYQNYEKEVGEEKAADMIMASGKGISVLGDKFRDVLRNNQTLLKDQELCALQRPEAQRPAIERGLNFHGRNQNHAPLERGTTGSSPLKNVKSSVDKAVDNLTQPFKNGQYAEGAAQAAELLTLGGLAKKTAIVSAQAATVGALDYTQGGVDRLEQRWQSRVRKDASHSKPPVEVIKRESGQGWIGFVGKRSSDRQGQEPQGRDGR